MSSAKIKKLLPNSKHLMGHTLRRSILWHPSPKTKETPSAGVNDSFSVDSSPDEDDAIDSLLDNNKMYNNNNAYEDDAC
eukprot:2862809-Ditylum_brightwellii.AAC.1